MFTIKHKPEPDDKYVEVEAKIRGTHRHHDSSTYDDGDQQNSPNVSSRSSFGGGGASRKRKSLSCTSNDEMTSPQPSDKNQLLAKRKINQKNIKIENTTTTSIENSISSVATTYLAASPTNSTPSGLSRLLQPTTATTTNNALSLSEKSVVNQIVNQISNKIMIKLDQINLKVNQISDRLYDLERKLDSVEVAEIQF